MTSIESPLNRESLFDRQMLLVSGKGGVGKSAVTASLALTAAATGRRVLAMGMTDGLGLALHLGLETLTDEPVRTGSGVFAAKVDRARALDEYLKLQLRVPRSAPTKQLSQAVNVLVETAPGVREIISMGKPIYEAQQPEWDLVLVDAPPLGQLISYLRAPATLEALVPAGIVQSQAASMRRFLVDPERSGLALVTIPEELPIIETIEALDLLAAEPLIELTGLIANRVLPPLPVDRDVVDGIRNDMVREAAVRHLELYAAQQHWLDAIPGTTQLPQLFGMLTPGEVAARIASAWETDPHD